MLSKPQHLLRRQSWTEFILPPGGMGKGGGSVSVTGTMRIWRRNLGTRVGEQVDLWHIIAARLPPAEEPPMAIFEGLSERRLVPVLRSKRRVSSSRGLLLGRGFLAPVFRIR
jgi:hypothetical protein